MNRQRFTRLKALRLMLGLSVEQMSAIVGIDKSRYSRIENNWETRASKKINERFVSALGEGFDFLMMPANEPDVAPLTERLHNRVA